MDGDVYKQVFNKAIDELSTLMETLENIESEREVVKNRIAEVRSGVLALSPLIGEKPQSVENKYPHLFPDLITPDIGLTDAVRKVLKSNGELMTAVKVRTELKETGYDTGRYKNILASIHTILKRLVESDEATIGTVDDVTAYKFKQDPTFARIPQITAPRILPRKPVLRTISSKPTLSPEALERARKAFRERKERERQENENKED